MTQDQEKKLVSKALEVRKQSYSPYYKVYVGAALLAEDGSIHVGCNVENASGSAISCAEANALGAAISAGIRKFEGLAVVGFEDQFLYPCGVCLQRLSEFFAPDTQVLVAQLNGKIQKHAFKELLPHAISLGSRKE